MNMDGTIRAKVLQYKSDGNTLTEKWHTLTKFAEGIYLSYAAPDKYEQVYVTVVFAKNGVFWKVGCELEQCFRPDSFHYAEHVETLKKRYANYEAGIMQAVANGGWLNKLHITVMERLGYDTTAMIEAYDEVRRQREERDRQQAEKAERRERERMKAEERRKAEVLEDGKEKLLNHERITVEQIELIAETVGYKINIRTIGFMREKVTEVVMLDNDRVQVFGYKLTSRNIDGTAKVIHELYDQLKVQAEEETKQAATPIETPQISTKTAETVNVLAEGGNAAEIAENTPERKIKYFHYTPEQLKRYIIDVYQKNANGEWVLQPHEQIDTDTCLWDVVDGKIGWWTNWRREKFTEMNMDFNSPTCGRCCKINRTYQKDDFIVSNEKLLEFTVNDNYYYIQKQTCSKGKRRWCYAIMDAYGDFAVNDFSYTLKGIMQRFNKVWKENATIIWKSEKLAQTT